MTNDKIFRQGTIWKGVARTRVSLQHA